MKEALLKDVVRMIDAAAQTVIQNETYLSKLDSYVGDGDHGVTAARGFAAVQTALQDQEFASVGDLMLATSKALSQVMGGAIGPIIGGLFEGAGKYAKDKTAINTDDLAHMMRAGLDRIQLIGQAKEGDRTLVDALAPAVVTLEQNTDKPIDLALQLAAESAEKGAENTKNMIAKKGRARFLGDKSKGYQDAGATTMSLVIGSMADAIKNE